jgi:hypothetical protein
VICFFGMGALSPLQEDPVVVWWLQARKAVAKPSRKGFDTLVWLIAWSIWKERNHRIDERTALQPVALARAILEEARLWARAVFAVVAALLGYCRQVVVP